MRRPAVLPQKACCGSALIPPVGEKWPRATLWLPRRERVLIGVDDTDTSEEGATWTLVHNIAKAVEDEQSVYLSHTIVQLFPVAYRTKNCVSLVAEFATTEPERLTERFRELLEKYTLSEKTGMAVYTGFAPSAVLLEYGRNGETGGGRSRHRPEPCRSRSPRDPERERDYRGSGGPALLYTVRGGA